MKKRQIGRLAILAAGLALAATSVTSCAGKKAADAAKAKKEAENAAVTVFAVSTTTATKGELKDYLEFAGDVAAKTNVDILPDSSGKIIEVKVNVGDAVSKDQVVALVDASRPGMTYEPGPVKSPISGTITAVNVVTGSMVSQQSSVARVSKMDTLEIGMSVPERYVSKIKLNQSAYLKFDAYPGESFMAKITEVSPVLDASSRTMAAKLSLNVPDPRIKAGMFARVKLITDTRNNIVKVPVTAIVSRFGEEFIFTVNRGEKTTVSKKTVSVGIRVDDKAEILSGLSAGDEIVVQGQTLLEDGSEINIVSTTEPLPETEGAQ